MASAPTYDLVMVLDPEAEDQERVRPLQEAQAAISSQGELLRHDAWGNRQLSYPIKRRGAGEYHLLQFHCASPELLQTLDRSLRIADEVLRFRIVKLAPGVPEAPDMRAAPRRAEADSRTQEQPGGPAQAPADEPRQDSDSPREPAAGA